MKRTKKDVSVTSHLTGTRESAFELIRDVLATAGRLVGTEAPGDRLTARALLGIGIGGVNPVVVTASVTGDSDSASQVELRAAGREGLIEQGLRLRRHPLVVFRDGATADELGW